MAQQTDHCGPAALGMLFAWNRRAVEIEVLVEEVLARERSGTLQLSLLGAARNRGLLAFPITGGKELLGSLAEGYPVIVLQDLAWFGKPRWHYAVAVGYENNGRALRLHSGGEALLKVSTAWFDRNWIPAERWGLLILPASEIPAGASEQRFLRAVLGLELAGQYASAETGYRAALTRWPESLSAWIGVGNTAYARGKLEAAALAFRRASELHPEAAAAFNNLAHVSLELGRQEEALRAARQAVALDGDTPAYRDTLARALETSSR